MGRRQSGILGDDLLIIAKEFSDFDRTNDRLTCWLSIPTANW